MPKYSMQQSDDAGDRNQSKPKKRRAGAGNNPPFKVAEQLTPCDDAEATLIAWGLVKLPDPARSFLGEIAREWFNRPWSSQAATVKTISPELTDVEVAAIIGVSSAELAANQTFQAIKQALGKVKLHKTPERRLKDAPYLAVVKMPEPAPPPKMRPKAFVTGLLGLEEREFGRFLRFWMWWRDLLWPRKAILIRTLLPEALDREMVELLNVRRETLQRHRLYRDFKLRNSPRRLTGGMLSLSRHNPDLEDEDFRDDDLDDFERAYTG